MLWRHPERAGRAVRLGYCLNLHAADTLAGLLQGMRAITLPLRSRLGGGGPFGVGLHLPAALARRLAQPSRARELGVLRAFLAEHGLDAFTLNAFPYGGFQREGLKAGVFEPTWLDAKRVAFTLAAAKVAVRVRGEEQAGAISISTHTGMHASSLRGEEDLDGCARNLARCAAALAALEEESGRRVVLSLEAEPRASCNDTAELAGFRARLLERGAEVLARERGIAAERARGWMERHAGTCLDTCHAAVEFEPPETALENATALGAPLGKLQFTSALALKAPASNDEARRRFLALDEPRFLHQVTGRTPRGLVRAGDLPEVARAFRRDPSGPWGDCDEWRCHFHVPVDVERLGPRGLGTTRAYADKVLALALERPELWGSDELHLEIETYTWDVLPREARGAGELCDGLEREYRHVIARLEAAGWERA